MDDDNDPNILDPETSMFARGNEQQANKGVLGSIFGDGPGPGRWFHLYMAGCGIVASASVLVFGIVSIYNPTLLEQGAQWMAGPWYARITYQAIVLWLVLGGVMIGTAITHHEWREFRQPDSETEEQQ